MLRAVIPAERTVALVTESLGLTSLLFLVALGLFAILTLVVVRFVGWKALGRDDENESNTSSSNSMPDESEWTVSYNPPSRRSENKKSGSSGSRRPSPSKSGRSSNRSSNKSASRSRSKRSSNKSRSKRSSTSSTAGASAGASKQSAADGSGETRLYDPATGNPTTDDPTDTDTRIFTGEKSDASGTACPDCGETPPSGTDWEFCPFCGIEL